ncbi:MAG: hypothetical protein LBP91_05620 [Coriobacteriales bacterium]|nr:hypothetical protein [Coriobacteriales bacterium]
MKAPDTSLTTRTTPFIARDGGFTTAGVAIALLLVVALLFTAVQVRWIASQSADIQFVADAGALAGDNVVGEYLIVARVADAVVLSLSLLGMATYGIAIVVTCIPYTSSVGKTLLEFGSKVFKARDKVAGTAAKALNKLQAALPFLIALNAAGAIEANAQISASRAAYLGLAFPLPLQGEDTDFADDEVAVSSAEMLGEHNEQTAELTDAAQEALNKMESSKLRAYTADCVNNPRYCLHERAASLAGLSGGSNPHFSSVESWLFDYAFSRAQTYYARRLAIESPANQSLDEQIRSLCRKRFYAYAGEELRAGWCYTSPDGTLDAYFPLFPKNTEEMRRTRLYTERVYPLSADGVLHGSTACSAYQAAGSAGSGSVAELEAGTCHSCSECRFAASTIGKVALASSNIDNGFEYYYRIIAEEATRYQAASEEYARQSGAAQDSARKGFDIFKEAMEALKTPRLKPHPPGHSGVIAIVLDVQTHSIPAAFTSSTVNSGAALQPRLALSAAALAEEKAAHGANILASFLDKAMSEVDQSSLALGALGVFDGILNIWGSALLVYSQGGDAISEGLVNFLDSIPLVKATPLSRWAKKTLCEVVETLGLQGADLNTPRPLLVNTLHVLRASDAAPARALQAAKEGYSSLSGSGSGTLGEALIEGLTGTLTDRSSQLLQSEFTLFEISFGEVPGLPTIPIKMRLPDLVVERGQAVVDNFSSSVSASYGGGGNHAIWE